MTNDSRLHITLALNSNRSTRYHLPCFGTDRVPSTVTPDDVIPRYRAFQVETSSTTVSGRSALYSGGDAGLALPNTVSM